MEVIKTINLTKYYGKARGIKNLNLTVNEGECFGFIGPNGAGKSTTIRTLLGLIFPTDGTATVLGHDIVSEKNSILAEVGYLPSEAVFYSGMKVKDILKFSADLRKKDCSKEAKTLCDRIQIDVNRKVDELSFGNRKKVGIVCALQSNPRLLILDEPTGGLDPLMQHEFFDIISEKNKGGTTVFLSSHILSEVQKYCTRAAVISEGEIIACDSVETLAKSNAKRVTVSGAIDLAGLDGIKDLKRTGMLETDAKGSVEVGAVAGGVAAGMTSFLYNGDMNELIQKLSCGTVNDITISEPDLEEIFLHYYGKGEGDKGGESA